MKATKQFARTGCVAAAVVLGTMFMPARSASAAPAPAPAAAATTAAATETYLPMCQAIEADLTGGTGQTFDQYFDVQTFSDIATKGFDPQAAASVKQGYLDLLKLGAQVRASVGESGNYKFLRFRIVDGKSRALFRLVGKDGLNYHELVLARDRKGRPCFTDFFVYASGELMSETLARLGRQLAIRPGQPLDDYTASMMRLPELRQLIATGRAPEALAVLKSMPEKARQEKVLQLVRVQAAAQVGGQEYLDALEDYRKSFGNDASSALIALDTYLVRGEYDSFFEAVDRVEKTVEGDPYLDVLRGSAHLARNDPDAARKLAQRAIQREPTLFDAQDLLLTVSLKQKDHATALKQLDLLEKQFGLEWKDLRKVPLFAEFVQSPEYRDWARRHRVN